MALKVEQTGLAGVLKITPATVFEDFRGMNVETYNTALYKEAGINVDFIHDAVSVSSQNVLRGFHGDSITWKLISCLFGKVYFVVLNWDEASPQYMRWESHILSAENHVQILVTPRLGNAHVVLSEHAVFSYKQSAYYNRAGQFTVPWNDQRLKIWWPVKNPLLSERDEKGA